MNLFKSALQKFENLGISRNFSSLNRKVQITIACFWAHTAANCVYFVREVSSFSEMANSILILSVSAVISTSFVILVVDKTKVYRLVDKSEKIIDQGKVWHHFNVHSLYKHKHTTVKINEIFQ